jgi:ATP-dependent exoDNAse (exonuclease V) beta subunit
MLVDYKTDRVDSAQSLWTLYGKQMALYRRALAEATRWPVREVTLFSLALGEGSAQAFDV